MSKRLFSAIWMGAFACLTAVPLLVGDTMTSWMVLPPLLTGGLMGYVFQAPVIGRNSNYLDAAMVGTICALLSIPFVILGTILVRDPQLVLRNPDKLLGNLFVFGYAAVGFFWWWILPMGAIAGTTLHFAWKKIERGKASV